MLPKLFFGYYAVVIIVLSLLVVTRKNPVHSVMWMLLLFFHIAGLYLFLNAEFIAAIQVIVYAGAILVLFCVAVVRSAWISAALDLNTNWVANVSAACAAVGLGALSVEPGDALGGALGAAEDVV